MRRLVTVASLVASMTVAVLGLSGCAAGPTAVEAPQQPAVTAPAEQTPVNAIPAAKAADSAVDKANQALQQTQDAASGD